MVLQKTWFDRQCDIDDYYDATGITALSHEWISIRYDPANFQPRHQQRLLQDFYSFARILDIDRSLTIRFATRSDLSTACATFRSRRLCYYEKPLILINPGLFQKCNFVNFIDVATGVFLHECGHILYTRRLFDTLEVEAKKPRIRFFCNLVEDARIEDLLIANSPGWAPYILAARKQLLIKEWFRPALRAWKTNHDGDKLLLIVALYLRAPKLLRDGPRFIRKWRDLEGQCVFDKMSEIVPSVLVSENDVIALAKKLLNWIDQYANRAIKHLATKPLEQVSTEERERLRNQIESDAEDKLKKAERQQQRTNTETRRPTIGDSKPETESEQSKVDSSQSSNGADHSERGIPPTGTEPSTFKPRLGSIDSLAELLERYSVITDQDLAAISDSAPEEDNIEDVNSPGFFDPASVETEPPMHLPKAKVRETKLQIQLPDRHRDEKVEIIEAHIAQRHEKYQNAVRATRNYSRRLAAAFQSKKVVNFRKLGSRSNGRLDPRAVWRAAFESDLFFRTVPNKPRRVLVVLLLDSSGSMIEGCAYLRALETAVLVNEAFSENQTIDVRVFGHTTWVNGCFIHDYGDATRARMTLSNYFPAESNYDHLAIYALIQKFKSDKQYTQKALISISDGLPCTPYSTYGHEEGIKATAAAVSEARRGGWVVLGCEIGKSNGAERIYGGNWLVRVDTAVQLSSTIASTLSKLLRRALT
jgi:hypothetical protein